MLDHWKKKHAATCFIPVTTDGPGEHLRLQDHVWLGEGTRFGLFLDALQEGTVYYDPGIKATLDLDAQVWKFKRRNQFRTAGKALGGLYRSFERVDLS
ncbi:hypothetical protein F8O07_07050 [Pseudoclavibacter sp. CFCC 13796]|nr:hypothetical protein F8O07_07050 [Pseudoclavibacter sp. CFCC 13796]